MPLNPPWRPRAKLAHSLCQEIQECLSFAGNVKTEKIPLLLCVAEKERPGRLNGLDDRLLPEVQDLLATQLPPAVKCDRPRSGGRGNGRLFGSAA